MVRLSFFGHSDAKIREGAFSPALSVPSLSEWSTPSLRGTVSPSTGCRLIQAKCFRHLLSMFSFQKIPGVLRHSHRNKTWLVNNYFVIVVKAISSSDLAVHGRCLSIPVVEEPHVEEAVEEHHGSGPDTWGIHSAAKRIVNQGNGKNETRMWKSPRPRPRWQPNRRRKREHPWSQHTGAGLSATSTRSE
ncbi:hypothetical protein Syun_031976 [Stephania yunnanensis]|uniref:Uncharacterized protein n=1 Tax=Stephania yunnanensis TaxID=152371 RepID=A0AAP0E454_9MAGN